MKSLADLYEPVVPGHDGVRLRRRFFNHDPVFLEKSGSVFFRKIDPRWKMKNRIAIFPELFSIGITRAIFFNRDRLKLKKRVPFFPKKVLIAVSWDDTSIISIFLFSPLTAFTS